MHQSLVAGPLRRVYTALSVVLISVVLIKSKARGALRGWGL